MGSLDEKISVVKAKPWLVSLVCAVFIAYPNLAWIFCDMSYLAPNDHQGFLLFFGFRFLYFWGLIWFGNYIPVYTSLPITITNNHKLYKYYIC